MYQLVQKIAQVRLEGGRSIKRVVPYYNLDMIISVGYRVNSISGTRFRQWANRVLKEHMLNGFSVNQRLVAHAKAKSRSERDNLFRPHQSDDESRMLTAESAVPACGIADDARSFTTSEHRSRIWAINSLRFPFWVL